jgi:mono/diheme cytochrome c family protein
MADQPSYKPLEPNDYFSDGQSARQLVEGTVARGHLRVHAAFFTGRSAWAEEPAIETEAVSSADPNASAQTAVEPNARKFNENRAFVKELPIPATEALLAHGFNRYMIYCTVCHDPLGTGRGKIVERGYTRPPSFHEERLRNSPVGRLFAVVTEGYGSMPSYGSQIPPEDRWAIVAYLRALQLSQRFPVAELTPPMRAALNKTPVTDEAPR